MQVKLIGKKLLDQQQSRTRYLQTKNSRRSAEKKSTNKWKGGKKANAIDQTSDFSSIINIKTVGNVEGQNNQATSQS